VKQGKGIKCYKVDGVYTIEYPEGAQSQAVADTLGIEHIGGSRVLTGMSHPERFGSTEFSLNGLRLQKLTYDTHIIKIIIVSDSESRVVQTYKGTTIVVSKDDYKNPEFIFLDEATNALDAKNERAIVENLSTFYQGKTVVVVAHRLSTVRHADQIIVLDKGRVVETGSHETLIAKKGAYYQLVKNQLELGN
jgi:ATP-binding cassette subfamily B protein